MKRILPQSRQGQVLRRQKSKKPLAARSSKAVGGRRFKVFFADDDPDILMLYEDIFKQYAEFKIVGSAQNLSDLKRLLKTISPDLLLLDIKFECPTTGLDLIPALRAMQPRMKILVVTGNGEQHKQESFLHKANGFLLKPIDLQRLLEAAKTVLGGWLYYDEGLLHAPALPAAHRPTGSGLKLPKKLTAKDQEYIEARLTGKSDAEIAKKKKINIETIFQRRHRIAKRLGLKTDIESFLLRLVRGRVAVSIA